MKAMKATEIFQGLKETRKEGPHPCQGQPSETEKMYAKALDIFGVQSQTLMLAEECAELVKACSKACRAHLDGRDSNLPPIVDNIAEEIADVRIMMAQMQMQYNIEDTTVESIMASKLERLRKRLEAYS